jgi:AcrR family transcriptional regulator
MKPEREQVIEQTKTSILLTARRIAAQQGWEFVSMRNIAKELNFTAPLIYSYFKNKEEILRELENQGFEELNKRLKSIRTKEPDPKTALVRMNLQLYEYAYSAPEMYQVMFNLEGVKCRAAKKKLIKKLLKNYKEVFATFNKKKEDIKGLQKIWWSMTHGYIALLMTDQIRLSPKKGKKELEKISHTTLQLL